MDGTQCNTIPSYGPAAVLLAVSILGWPSLGEAQEGLNSSQGKQLVLQRDMSKCRLPEGKMASSPEFVGEFWLGEVSELVI